MVDASQIPADTLSRMSTEGLVATCLSYPLLSTILAHNDLQTGFSAVTANFNGLQELLNRPDAGREIFKIYQKMDLDAIIEKPNVDEQRHFPFEFMYIELLLSQQAILDKLTFVERKSLLKEGFVKFKAKDNHLDTFSGFTKRTSALIIGRILEKEKYSSIYQASKSSVAMRTFLATGQVQDSQVINQIIIDAQAFVK